MDHSWSAIQVMDMIIKQTFLLVFRSSKYNEHKKKLILSGRGGRVHLINLLSLLQATGQVKPHKGTLYLGQVHTDISHG